MDAHPSIEGLKVVVIEQEMKGSRFIGINNLINEIVQHVMY